MKGVIAANFDFQVLSESEEWIVLNKPAPLQIHPSKPSDAGLTLWDGVKELLRYELANGGQISIINRLDRETSGLVLIAKTAKSARRFGKAMARRQIQKRYMALVHGWPDWEEYTADGPILRAGDVEPCEVHVKQKVHPDGVESLSHFKVLQRSERESLPFSWIECEPKTGRMHQLRVHLSHAGYPIVGDKLYGILPRAYLDFIEKDWTEEMQRTLLLPRQALHSCSMSLDLEDSPTLHWEAPLTQDLQNFLPFVPLESDPGR